MRQFTRHSAAVGHSALRLFRAKIYFPIVLTATKFTGSNSMTLYTSACWDSLPQSASCPLQHRGPSFAECTHPTRLRVAGRASLPVCHVSLSVRTRSGGHQLLPVGWARCAGLTGCLPVSSSGPCYHCSAACLPRPLVMAARAEGEGGGGMVATTYLRFTPHPTHLPHTYPAPHTTTHHPHTFTSCPGCYARTGRGEQQAFPGRRGPGAMPATMPNNLLAFPTAGAVQSSNLTSQGQFWNLGRGCSTGHGPHSNAGYTHAHGTATYFWDAPFAWLHLACTLVRPCLAAGASYRTTATPHVVLASPHLQPVRPAACRHLLDIPRARATPAAKPGRGQPVAVAAPWALPLCMGGQKKKKKNCLPARMQRLPSRRACAASPPCICSHLVNGALDRWAC